MNILLSNQIVIENVLLSKLRGKIIYLGNVSATTILDLHFVKLYNDPSGKGYQRPIDKKRSADFANYLSKGEDSLFTPILLNASSNWEFTCYDQNRPNFGRLLCKGKATLMDGQHRLGGIQQYIKETNSIINVPFISFHYLDEDEEIKLFDTINTKARGIGTSLSKYLSRDSDEYSWIATQLLTIKESPFYENGSLTGKRNKGRHITLQNLYRTLSFLFKDSNLINLTKEEKLRLSILYYTQIQEVFPSQWSDYRRQRLTHIVCLDALSIAGSQLLSFLAIEYGKSIDYKSISSKIKKIKKFDWSVEGPLKYLKGISGSKTLATELIELMTN